MTAFTLSVERHRVTQALHLGCTVNEMQFLDTLRCEGPLSVNDIGQRLRMGHAVVSNIADRLEQKGFVGRGVFRRDRRRVKISLGGPRTEDLALSDQDLNNAFGHMDESTRHVVWEAMTTLAEHLAVTTARLDDLPPLHQPPRRIR